MKDQLETNKNHYFEGIDENRVKEAELNTQCIHFAFCSFEFWNINYLQSQKWKWNWKIRDLGK